MIQHASKEPKGVFIHYLERSSLAPRFGCAILPLTVCVRNDLPDEVKSFVLFHEVYHLRDKAKWWIWREVKANIYGAYHCPTGFLKAVKMSMTKERIAFYIKRFKEGK